MAIEHNVITDPEIHEPKGASTAILNTVYRSDGAGSGDWEKVAPDNYVFVHTASDLPSASGGVRTLAANTVYWVNGQVDLGSDRLVVSNNTVIHGVNQNYDELTSTTTGALITQTNVNARFTQVKLTCASGTLFDIDGTGVESSDWIRVNATCDTIGDIDNLDTVDLFRCTFDAASAGMTLTGAHSRFIVTACTVDVAATNATCIDLGTATFDHIHIDNTEFLNPTGTGFGLDVAAAGANINTGGVGSVLSSTFSNATEATNYVEGDAKWNKWATPDFPPTIAKAQGSVKNNANANAFGGGVGVAEVVNFGTSFVADVQDKFTVSNAGRFTYDGASKTVVKATATTYVTMAGGAARIRNLFIAKNGTVVASSEASQTMDGTNPATIVVASIVSLDTTDYIELFIEAETATTSTIVDTASITVAEI